LRHTRDQVCALLKRGGFTLRKWASNQSELSANILPDDHELACNKILKPDESLNILRISWNPALDSFQFQVSLPESLSHTKRVILSTIAKLFDPLRWITPVIIIAKIFMQQLWRLELEWDDDSQADINAMGSNLLTTRIFQWFIWTFAMGQSQIGHPTMRTSQFC